MSVPEASIAALQEMIGMDRATCESLLLTSGGNLDTAIAIFFEQQQTGDAFLQESASSQAPSDPVDALIFPTRTTPPSWSEQGFQSIHGTLNVLQKKNGPCGVLVCLLAQIAVQRFESKYAKPMDTEAQVDEIQQAVFNILSRCCNSPSKIKFNGQAIKHWSELPGDLVTREGCLIHLVKAVVETKGVEQIRKEVQNSHGELPLVVGPHSLCSSELMSLLIRGKADGNFTAVDTQKGAIVDDAEWSRAGFGLLTRPSEITPPANGLKFPRYPVWIVHGGDHFTLLIGLPEKQKYLHLNGLPPAGPSSTVLWIESTVDAERITDASSVQQSYVKPVPGEVEDIVQAKPEDKVAFKDDWKKWRVECILAIDDPTVKDGGGNAANRAREIKLYELKDLPKPGDKFRCAACYRDRFRTMNFGEQTMANGQTTCAHCGKAIKEAQWTIWLTYNELTRANQMRVDRMFASKLLNVIRTRWPDALVYVGEEKNPSAILPST